MRVALAKLHRPGCSGCLSCTSSWELLVASNGNRFSDSGQYIFLGLACARFYRGEFPTLFLSTHAEAGARNLDCRHRNDKCHNGDGAPNDRENCMSPLHSSLQLFETSLNGSCAGRLCGRKRSRWISGATRMPVKTVTIGQVRVQGVASGRSQHEAQPPRFTRTEARLVTLLLIVE